MKKKVKATKKSTRKSTTKKNNTKCISTTLNGTYRVRKMINGRSYDKTFTSMTKAISYRNSLR